jgi:hypothetical protein
MAIALALALCLQVTSTPESIDAGRLILSKPTTVVQLSGDTLPGFPLRLVWSPDRHEIYLRLIRRDRWANETLFHYFISVRDGQIRIETREPSWAVTSWAGKSAYACPGLPAFRIETDTRTEIRSATNSGAGGAIAQNSGDPYGPGFELGPQGQAILSGAMQSQRVTTVIMKVKGQIVGEFINAEPIPGLMFGWGPAGFEALAYANSKRRLVVMDKTGTRHEARETKGVLLPAWSPDGSRLAWLEQTRSRTFVVTIADVARR